MKIGFRKYQGTGNDFVMIDNMTGEFDDLSIDQIAFVCDRKMGVGADGLIKLSSREGVDFEVEYYNSDGSQSFCGNGARCALAFAVELGIVDTEAKFLAIDGEHVASYKNGMVRLEMLPVHSVQNVDNDYFLDTGSPHFVHFSENLEIDIVDYGRNIRYSKRYNEVGVNVNVVLQEVDHSISVQTYERGVEDETLSCGTGVTACALIQMMKTNDYSKLEVNTKGGQLFVEANFDDSNGGFSNIWLSGLALKVFDGSIDV